MTDLTDRMRTCAEYIISRPRDAPMPTDAAELDVVLSRIDLVLTDAADLLIEASNLIEVAHLPLGEPMEIIPPIAAQPQPPDIPTGVWTDLALPTLQRGGTTSPRACPVCDSRANKTVRRVSCAMMITCQVCGHEWEFKR